MSPDIHDFVYAAPVFLALVAIEAIACLRLGRRGYSWGQSLASLGVGLGHKLVGSLKFGGLAAAAAWLFGHRLFDIPLDRWWGIPALFLAVELVYYWHHRLSHQVRWLWASHAVHHSSEELNILAAYRLAWTGMLTGGVILFLPLILIGFNPVAIAATLALNLFYQAWIHTDLIPKLGPVELLFNTPSNHRVHHAVNPNYLDRNFGGVTVIFDRLFGTYVEEREEDPCRYGLVVPLASVNPARIAFHEWIAMGKDVLSARRLRDIPSLLFASPGWRPEASSQTAADLRREHHRVEGLAWDESGTRESGSRLPKAASRALLGVVALGIAAFGAAQHAYPQGAAASASRQAAQSACSADYKRMCQNVIPGGGRIIACMREHREELTPGCAKP